jgi:hypothetical protein
MWHRLVFFKQNERGDFEHLSSAMSSVVRNSIGTFANEHGIAMIPSPLLIGKT